MNLRQETAIKLRAQGKTLQEIGDLFGVTRERIRQIIAGAGVSTGTVTKPCVDCGRVMQNVAANRKRCIDCGAIHLSAQQIKWREANPDRVRVLQKRYLGSSVYARNQVAYWKRKLEERLEQEGNGGD
jgi:hypothetical protein